MNISDRDKNQQNAQTSDSAQQSKTHLGDKPPQDMQVSEPEGEETSKKGFFERRRESKQAKLQIKQAKEAEKVAAAQAAAAAKAADLATKEAAERAENAAKAEANRLKAEAMAAEKAAKQSQKAKQPGFLARLKDGLSRTSSNFGEGLGALLLGKKEIDEELLEDIETQLIVADVGIEAAGQIVANLTGRVSRRELFDADALYLALQDELEKILAPSQIPLQIDKDKTPYVILVVGVNGVGKTTTIGKLAKRFQKEGMSVMLAAGDTFRAAAVEQLQVWGERNGVAVVAQHSGADSASVIFDAVQAARSRNIDVLIADTAGRLHNKDHLMDELKKVVRVMGKLDASAPHEVMLVLDAGTGQNALTQAQVFQQTVGVTGITLTKLDGTAKGGIIFAVSKQLGLPIRFIGVGEQVDDLRSFQAADFVKALFDQNAFDQDTSGQKNKGEADSV